MTERYFKFDVNEFRDRKCNFHSHTKRCKHAGGEEREYVEAAIAEGFEVIGFSDHSPYLFEHGYVSGIRMDMRELEGYVRTVEELKREYRKDIEIYVQNVPFKTIYIALGENSAVRATIRRNLEAQTEVKVVNDRKEAEAIFELLGQSRGSNVPRLQCPGLQH